MHSMTSVANQLVTNARRSDAMLRAAREPQRYVARGYDGHTWCVYDTQSRQRTGIYDVEPRVTKAVASLLNNNVIHLTSPS